MVEWTTRPGAMKVMDIICPTCGGDARGVRFERRIDVDGLVLHTFCPDGHQGIMVIADGDIDMNVSLN